ncbi:LIM-domain binding protein-domain-containing protein [Dichotomocladium elegans]|nr:LIM-domain binding protein-domain-containing protein [Dichotomocladium elegans]
MSTGTIPTPQQLPSQLAQSLRHQQHSSPLPQTPHVQPQLPHGVSPHPMPIQQLQGHAQFQVQQLLQNRHRIVLQQQTAAASAARSGERPHPSMQQQPATALSASSMSAPQQAMSPQPAALPNGMPTAKSMPPSQPLTAISASTHQSLPPSTPQEQTHFAVPNPQRSAPSPSGQAILRLLEFADKISPGEQANSPAFWDQFADDFFTASSVLKLGLWSAQKNMNEFYELTRPTVPSFFLQHYACHVSSMQMTLERSSETILADESVNIDCSRASLIHRYQNGEMVVLTGSLEAQFRRMDDGIFKIEKMEIRCSTHAEFIERTRMIEMLTTTSKTSKAKGAAAVKNAQNESPVNEWGIPSRLYEWLKVAETMGRIDEIMFYSQVTNATPRESLQSLAYEATLQNHESAGSGGSSSSGKGGGKVKGTKRDTKTKERPKLTRQKSTRTKKSATDKNGTKTTANATGNDASFTNNNKNKNMIGGNANAAAAAAAAPPSSSAISSNSNVIGNGNNLSPVVKTQNAGSVTNTPMQLHSQLPIASAAFSPQHQMQLQQHQMMMQQRHQQQQQQALYHHQQQALLQQQVAAASIPQQHTSTAYHASYPAQLHQPGV